MHARVLPSAFLFATALALPSSAQKLPPITTGASLAQFVELAAEGDHVYAVWRDDRDGQPRTYFNASDDRGASWRSSDVVLDPGHNGGVSWCTIVASGATVHVAWSDLESGTQTVRYNRSLDRGITWLPSATTLNTTKSLLWEVELAVTGSVVHAAWTDQSTGGHRYRRSTDNGTTWSQVATVSTTGADLKMAVSPTGSAVGLTWIEGSFLAADVRVMFARSADGGTSWSTPTELASAPNANVFRPNITWAGSSHFVVVYFADVDGGHLLARTSQDAGATFGPPASVDRAPAGVKWLKNTPLIVADGSRVHVLWDDQRLNGPGAGVEDPYFNRSTDSGLTWGEANVRLNGSVPTGQSEFINGSMSLSASGNMVLATWWGFGIRYNRSTDRGATWLTADRGLPRNPDSWPSARVLGDRAYLAWGDRPGVRLTIPFGLQRYGTGKPGTGGIIPDLDGHGPTVIGRSVGIDVTQGVGGGSALLALGTQKATTPLLGGTLLVAPTLVIPFALGGTSGSPGAGTTTLELDLPDEVLLIGLPVFGQVVAPDAGAAQGVSLSNGVELWIG